MRCVGCGYALWNLIESRCPECGLGIELHRYRFRPDTVVFRCPYCNHAHPGQGPQHLPSEFGALRCAGCGEQVVLSDMMVMPTVDPPVDAMTADLPPWEHREQRGAIKTFWETCVLSATNPEEIGDRLRADGSWSQAYRFAVMVNAVSSIAYPILILLWMGAALGAAPAGGGDVTTVIVTLLAAVLLWALAALLLPLMLTVFVAGPTHLVLRLTGDVTAGFTTTARTVLYGQGPMVFAVLPICVCGPTLHGLLAIWAMVVTAVSLSHSQGVGGLRATVAVLGLPLMVACAAMVIAFIVVFASGA